MNCKEASQLISQSLDRHLGLRERSALRLHLLICKYCLRFNQQLQTLRTALRKMESNIENDPSITLSSESKTRIAETIESNID